MRKKKVCLITPNHIATNPRLVKEATALSTAGYLVHIVFTQHVRDVVKEDLKILHNNPSWTYSVLDWSGRDKKSKSYRFAGGLFYKVNSVFSQFFNSLFSSKIILNRNYLFQLRAAVGSQADIFIAHNIGALAVAGDAANKLKRKFAFDAEDYHRGQSFDAGTIKMIARMEDTYIPKASYISAASPLIASEYDLLYSIHAITINNVFPLVNNKTETHAQKSQSLKLFWFSQSVGLDRGLQDVFAAMKIKEHLGLEFSIYGNILPAVKSEFALYIEDLKFKKTPNIYYKGTVSPDELLVEANKYDIGLAIEPGFCKNNEIALSNKIFTYLLGGNAIIFSNTPAQLDFYITNQNVGYIYNTKDAKKLAELIQTYNDDRELLRRHMINSRKLYETEFNWENVQKDFLSSVRNAVYS